MMLLFFSLSSVKDGKSLFYGVCRLVSLPYSYIVCSFFKLGLWISLGCIHIVVFNTNEDDLFFFPPYFQLFGGQ
jgi:hypothetical protein